MPRVALVTCADLADLEDDDRLLIEPLRERGIEAVPAVWDDPGADWADFDLVVLRSPWDYARRRDQFLAWAHSVPQLLNPAKLVEWNTDKTYLRALASAGVPVVPTQWFEPGDRVDLPDDGEYVIKPAVSAGSLDTGRYRFDDAEHRRLGHVHVERLLRRGSTIMLQPYLSGVDTAGETAMLFLGGEFSHAIGKAAILDGPDRGTEGLFRPERIEPRTPSAAEHDVAAQTLRAVPEDHENLLYARVDLIPAADGTPIVLEVELTEPSLFLQHGPGAPHRLAAAIAARI